MDIQEFFELFQEYALDNENYKKWREIHGKAFGDIFLSAFQQSQEAQLHLTAALIRISKRDFQGGLTILLMLENACIDDFDCFAIFYFIGLCYEFLENEEQMNKYYEKMAEYDEDEQFLVAFHPYYRTAKLAQRKSENEKALKYYNKALGLYSGNETNTGKKENMGQIYYDMGTVCLSCHDNAKAWEYIEKSIKYSPAENPQRNYVTAILCATEGRMVQAHELVDGLPDYLKANCQQIISSLADGEGK